MNCQSMTALTAWRCKPAGRHSIMAVSPFTLGDDGLCASFYVMQESENRFHITDAHQAVLHAAEMGVNFTEARRKKIAATPGVRFAEIANDGEISAFADSSTLKFALWDAVKLAMAVSNRLNEWLPKTNQERFSTQVRQFLENKIDRSQLKLKPVVVGASGHEVQFPLAVLTANRFMRYVQPVGLSDTGSIDWSFVYQTFGKFSDVKQVSDPALSNRIVLIEPGIPDEDFGRAATLLSDAAQVSIYRQEDDLIDLLLAT